MSYFCIENPQADDEGIRIGQLESKTYLFSNNNI